MIDFHPNFFTKYLEVKALFEGRLNLKTRLILLIRNKKAHQAKESYPYYPFRPKGIGILNVNLFKEVN